MGLLAMSNICQIFWFFVPKMLDTHKEILRPYCQNHTRSILSAKQSKVFEKSFCKGPNTYVIGPEKTCLESILTD